jgi:hypothetical protein
MIADQPRSFQIPLIEFIESDDLYLERQEDVLWFDVLRNLDWPSFRPIAARYYEALWLFNVRQAQRRAERNVPQPPNPETESEATRRLLFERATMCEDTPVIHELPDSVPSELHVDSRTLRPGTPPSRWAGKKPKCFFAIFKAFVGVMLRGRPAEPEIVYEELQSNPSFARTCGFTLPRPDGSYRHTDLPSLRKLEQFDQIMTETGLWGQAKVGQVARNLQTGHIHAEPTVVHDTTHYHAFSSMKTVEVPLAVPSEVPEVPEEPQPSLHAATEVSSPKSGEAAKPASAQGKKAKKPKNPRRKSHPKTTKRCRCEDRQHCPHPWVNADDGAGTVVKSTGKMYWAHKASTLCFPGQQVLLDAVALSDAATHDSQSLAPHLERLFQLHPELQDALQRVLDDGAADDQSLKDLLRTTWDLELLAPINPRRRQPLCEGLPRGVDHITPTGTPVCQAGYPFDFVGCRHDTQRFLFRAPLDAQGLPVCQTCAERSACYRGRDGARQITVGFDRLPWIDPKFPQLSRRFALAMAHRTAIERLHKLMKYDYGDEQLTKRGNAAFQARLDKTLLAMQLVLAHD